MTSKRDIVRKLHEHRKLGSDLIAAWSEASDETTALRSQETEKNEWLPNLIKMLRDLDSTLVTRYESHLTPFEHPSVGHHPFLIQWPDIDAGYRCTVERVFRLRDDVDKYAQKHNVDLSVNEPKVTQFLTKKEKEIAYSQRVKKIRKDTGDGPKGKFDEAWGKKHGLSREEIRELRRESPDRSKIDKRGGRPKLAKK